MQYITSEFIKIPNILVMDKEIPIGAKYFYALIDYYYFIGITNIPSTQLLEDLDISLPTLKKYIKVLRDKKYIAVNRKNQYENEIIPLIERKVVLDFKTNQKAHKEQDKAQAYKQELNPEVIKWLDKLQKLSEGVK